jgi:hypothetical protein
LVGVGDGLKAERRTADDEKDDDDEDDARAHGLSYGPGGGWLAADCRKLPQPERKPPQLTRKLTAE